MSPDTPMFGRITVGGNRTTLGRGGSTVLLMRVAEQLRKIRPNEDAVIQIELSRTPLPDATTFDKLARVEQSIATHIETDPDAASPWPGVTVGTVALAMASHEYVAYEEICDPHKRAGLTESEIERIVYAYSTMWPDCISHFPKWIES